MTQISLRAHKKGDPKIPLVFPSGMMVHVQDTLTCVVLEAGMQSGEPSVMILGIDNDGVGVVLETSLDKFIMAAMGLKSLAENQLGWKQPEGHASIIPGGPIDQVRVHEIPEGCYDQHCTKGHIDAVFTTRLS